jgi:hypothetical protein
MLTDFTNKQAGKAARLTDVAGALGAAIAKRLDAWLLTWANLLPAGFTPVSLRPGWTCFMPPASGAGASPLLNPAAVPLVSGYPYPRTKPCRDRTVLTASFNTVEHRARGLSNGTSFPAPILNWTAGVTPSGRAASGAGGQRWRGYPRWVGQCDDRRIGHRDLPDPRNLLCHGATLRRSKTRSRTAPTRPRRRVPALDCKAKRRRARPDQ